MVMAFWRILTPYRTPRNLTHTRVEVGESREYISVLPAVRPLYREQGVRRLSYPSCCFDNPQSFSWVQRVRTSRRLRL